MSLRRLRRLVTCLAVVVTAGALGTFVIGRDHVAASSTLMENPGMRLVSASTMSEKQLIAEGRTLFVETCSFCHGVGAQGSVYVGGTHAPSLLGVGGGTVNLWLTAGWMPLKTPGVQPEAKPVTLTANQIDAIVAYVVSLRPGGVPVPVNIDLKNANAADGFSMFSLNCAPCHTITGSGDALAAGAHAPSLHTATATQVLEAIRSGPLNMPRFGPGDISDQQALDITLYVTKYIQHPANIGGIGLGGIGPVAEGFVGLFIGVGVCLLAAYWVGDRTAKDDDNGHDESDDEHGGSEGEGGSSEPVAGETDASSPSASSEDGAE